MSTPKTEVVRVAADFSLCADRQVHPLPELLHQVRTNQEAAIDHQEGYAVAWREGDTRPGTSFDVCGYQATPL